MEQFLKPFAIVVAILAYVYATVGFANRARHRWESLVLTRDGGDPNDPEILETDGTLERAIKQAKKDFHYWYGSFFFAMSAVMVVLLVVGAWNLFDGAAGSWWDLIVYVMAWIAVIVSVVFCYHTYTDEARHVLRDWRWYRLLFPNFLPGRPPPARRKPRQPKNAEVSASSEADTDR